MFAVGAIPLGAGLELDLRLAGRPRVEAVTDDGRVLCAAMLSRGDVFGEMLKHGAWTAKARQELWARKNSVKVFCA